MATGKNAPSDPNDQTHCFIDRREYNRNKKKKVLNAQRCSRPMEELRFLYDTLGIGHEGVIVTLEDGKTKYLVHKLPIDMQEQTGSVVVAYASKMGQTWRYGESKKVKSSILSDYEEVCGYRYVLDSDDCRHAVQRMWALP